jgi:hypothetical protein
VNVGKLLSVVITGDLSSSAQIHRVNYLAPWDSGLRKAALAMPRKN